MSKQTFVLDNSVVIAWVLAEDDQRAETVMDLLESGTARVPGIWPFEFANALVMAERRKRLTQAEAAQLRDIVSALPIEVVQESRDRICVAIAELAREHGLSVYDASYLDLALREGLPMATLDERLCNAAQRCGVSLVI